MGLVMATSTVSYGKYLGIVLCISRVQRDRLQIEATIKIDRGDNVPLERRIKPYVHTKSQWGDTHCKVGTIPLAVCVAPGVAAGVVGVTPVPSAFAPFFV
jgi:hypothetical protein